MNNKIKNHIKDHSNLINKNVGAISICIDKIAKDMDRDFFMSAKESIDYGLADFVAENK